MLQLLGCCMPFVHVLKSGPWGQLLFENKPSFQFVSLSRHIFIFPDKKALCATARMKIATPDLPGSKLFVFQIMLWNTDSLLLKYNICISDTPRKVYCNVSAMKHTLVCVHIWVKLNYLIHEFLFCWGGRGLFVYIYIYICIYKTCLFSIWWEEGGVISLNSTGFGVFPLISYLSSTVCLSLHPAEQGKWWFLLCLKVVLSCSEAGPLLCFNS